MLVGRGHSSWHLECSKGEGQGQGLGWGQCLEGLPSGLGSLLGGGGRGCVWHSGLWDAGQTCSFQNGIPTASAAPGGSRRLPKGGEKAPLWPSLVIRPFNCNYFCN